MKTFKTAGVSKLNGKFALRATNREGDTYATILKKESHTDVHLVTLKHEMTKEEIRKYLPGLKAFQEPAIIACLKAGDEKETTAAKKKVAQPKTAKAPAKKKASKKKASANKKGDEAAGGGTATDGSEVATTEHDDNEHVDVAAELGTPAFAKHTE